MNDEPENGKRVGERISDSLSKQSIGSLVSLGENESYTFSYSFSQRFYPSIARMLPFGKLPRDFAAGSPSLNTMKVGMLMTS